MNGIFIRPTAGGFEVIRVDASGHFPMDFYKTRAAALRYGHAMAKQFKLALFEERP